MNVTYVYIYIYVHKTTTKCSYAPVTRMYIYKFTCICIAYECVTSHK